jgi:hypothetical protein
MNYEELQAMEDAHYWFTIQHMADYVELNGFMKVTKDIFSVIENRKASRVGLSPEELADVPF